MTDRDLSARHPEGETVLWESTPSAASFYFNLGLAGIFVVAGLLLLLVPLAPITGFDASFGQRILPSLITMGFGIALGAAFWRQRPDNVQYQLTDRQLRFFLGGEPAKRLVRGELRHLRCLNNLVGGATIALTETNGFTGNPAGMTQRGVRLIRSDAERVLARLANWTVGDESAAEAAAAAFVADVDGQGRTISEPRHRIALRLPADWPVESRRLERGPAKAFGKELPVHVIRRGALLPLLSEDTEWDGLRVRASDRVGLYLEITDRTSDADLREVRARWEGLGPLQAESDAVSIAGFRGVMAEQQASSPAPAPEPTEPVREWSRDGVEDQGFGYVGAGAHRILLWATDGEIAVQVRAFAPTAEAASARALREVLQSIRRQTGGE